MTRLREELAASVGHPFEGTWAANGSNEILTAAAPGVRRLRPHGGRVRADVPPPLAPRVADADRRRVAHAGRRVRALGGRRLDRRRRRTRTSSSSARRTTRRATPSRSRSSASLAGRTDALVIVDEAYIEFGGATRLPLVDEPPERRRHPHDLEGVRARRRADRLRARVAGRRRGPPARAPAVPPVARITQAAGIAALRHAKDALAILDAIRDERDRILAALARDARRQGLSRPTRTSSCSCRRSPPPRSGRVCSTAACSSATSRRVVPNALRVTAGTRDEVDLFLSALEEVLAHDRAARTATVARTTKETDVRVELVARRRGDRRPPTPDCRSSTTCCSSSGTHAGFDLQVTAKGDLRGRRPPHRRGRGHRARAGAGGGARRQAGHPAVRVDHRAARRGRGRGRAGPVGTRRSSSTRSTSPRR